MPLMLAFVASALLHAAALVGPGWTLPGDQEPEAPAQTIDAVIARPPAHKEAPPPKPAPRPATPKPKPAATPPVLAAPSPMPAPAVAAAPVSEPAAPPAPAPLVEPAPAAAPAAVPAPPQPARTALSGRGRQRYVITRGEGGFVIGQAVHTWEHDGFRYRLRSLTETTGLAALFKPAQVLQKSEGEVTDEGLRPREFRHERVGGVDTASFDWATRSVAYGGRQEPIVKGTQDMLSMYYALVLLAPRAGVVEMPIATGRKLETYRWEVLGEETLKLPRGEPRALHLRTRSGSDSIEIWLHVGESAAARGLPLKIRFTDRKGEIFDQVAEEVAEKL